MKERFKLTKEKIKKISFKRISDTFAERLESNKGFTLIEIIVVLVILAILAAAMIPTMIGFVDDARGKAEIANARAAYLACQAIATEEYLTDVSVLDNLQYTINNGGVSHPKLDSMLGMDMAGARVNVSVSSGKVYQIVYTTIKGDYNITIQPPSAAKVDKVSTPPVSVTTP